MTRANISVADCQVLANFADAGPDLFTKLAEHDSALDSIGAPVTGSMTETITSGAATLTTKQTLLSTTGTVAYSLANGTQVGQTHVFEEITGATTPLGTLTVATMDTAGGGTNATFVFTAIGQRLELQWNGSSWHIIGKRRAGRQAIVVGTTVLTGFVMFAAADLSVTGTVHSTTTKGFPAGQVAGEEFYADVTTALTSALGDIAITAKTTVGVAATSWANIGNTSTTKDSCGSFRWDGAAWQALSFTAGAGTATLS